MPAISPLPPAPSISDPANFNSEADAWVAAIDPMTDEINALEAGLRAAANPISLPYTFSTTTTDSDPGSGMLRLGSATQNAATVIRVDLVDDLGITRTTQIDTFDDSTNPVKGWLRLQKAGDASAFLDFRVTALATPSGYRNITVSCIAFSSSNPFADGDLLALLFVPAGDKGDTGAFATWTQIGSTATISGTPTTVDFTSIPSIYSDLMLVIDASLSTTASLAIAISSNNGSPWTSPTPLSLFSGTAHRGIAIVHGYRQDYQGIDAYIAALSSSPVQTIDTSPIRVAGRVTGGLNAVQLGTTGGTFLSGTVKLLGR